MLSKLKHPIVLAAGAAVVAMVLIFVSVYDWGSDDHAASSVAYRTHERPAPAGVVHSPQPAPAPAAAPAAETAPEAAAVTEPEPPKEVTYEDAETAFFEKRYDDAVEMFTRYTGRKSENPWGFYMLGLSAWKAGDNEGAETAFERALELDQKHVKSWINLSRVLLDASRPSEALARLDEALALDPQSNAAYRLRGRAFQQLGRIDESVSAYRRAIQIDETDVWSMNNLGLLYICPRWRAPSSCATTSPCSTTTSAWRSSSPVVSARRKRCTPRRWGPTSRTKRRKPTWPASKR
jgi:hypothetical protein